MQGDKKEKMVSVGSILDGKVVSIMPFGAFVSIGDNQSGLVHISEVSADYIKDINDRLKVGDSVRVKVIKIDESGRINLSIKKAAENEKLRTKKEPVKAGNGRVCPADVDLFIKSDENLSFEDKLSKFKQDSDEKIQALKKNADSKRSGGYSRRGGFSF